MEKVVRNGLVAVVYSPGFGAGWYTWNKEHPELIFDPNIVKYVEDQDDAALRSYLGLKFPNIYVSNYNDLAVEWVPVGTAFRIDEYDGNESIVTKDEDDWFVA
jgi:hypothetical protein